MSLIYSNCMFAIVSLPTLTEIISLKSETVYPLGNSNHSSNLIRILIYSLSPSFTKNAYSDKRTKENSTFTSMQVSLVNIAPPLQDQFVSIVQVEEHPSPSTVLPSSHSVVPSTRNPSPQISTQVVGETESAVIP